jgi:hypothetical protein
MCTSGVSGKSFNAGTWKLVKWEQKNMVLNYADVISRKIREKGNRV